MLPEGIAAKVRKGKVSSKSKPGRVLFVRTGSAVSGICAGRLKM